MLAETSVPKLHLAALIPGILLAVLFSLIILLLFLLRPGWGGRERAALLGERLQELIHLVPPLGLFLIVVGSIYAGLATPTEATSLGVMAALALAGYRRAISLPMLLQAFLNTIRFASTPTTWR